VFEAPSRGAIKIGYSRQLDKREKQLSYEVDKAGRIIASAPGGYLSEQSIHAQCSQWHIERELFDAAALPFALSLLEERRP
jgi:hypothetical protein